MTRNSRYATIYTLTLGILGLAALVWLTEWQMLYDRIVPLTFFAALSLVVKRAGFHVAPQVTHSLVGIVDLAAVFAFGPIQGAWVAATSGFAYMFATSYRRNRRSPRDLFEVPTFNAGLKIGMAYAATAVYRSLGGSYAPEAFTVAMIPAVLAAILAWFIVEHVGWGLLQWLEGGRVALISFYRAIFLSSLFVELLPLPFSIVIAIVYSSRDLGIFLMMSLGLVGTAFIVQQFADTSARLERRRNELTVLNDFGQAIASAGLDEDQVVKLLDEHARRIVPADLYRVELFKSKESSRWRDYFLAQRDAILIPDLQKQPAPIPLDPIDGISPRGVLIVPLWAADRLTGALTLYSSRTEKFFPIHARNLTSMCTQAAVAIQNARLYASERKRATQLTTVSDVSRQVAAFLDLDELLNKVVFLIRDRFGYTHAHIFTTDNESRRVVFRASTHPRGAEWRRRGVGYRIGLEGMVGWVAAIGEALMVNDVSQEPRFAAYPDQHIDETRSEVVVPLLVGTEIVGVLDVESEQLNRFTEDDLFILKTLAAQIAIALEDARLYRVQKEEAYYLNVLLQVAENLGETIDLNEALQTIVRITPILIGVERCAIFLYDAASKNFLAAQVYGLSERQIKVFGNLHFDAEGENAFGILFRNRKPLVISDAATSPLLRRGLARAFGIETLLIAPLITRGEIVGALMVDQGTRPTQFNQHEIDVVMGIAHQAAIAIEGARLGKEAEEKQRLEYELGLARQIQTNFLPEACPIVPGFEIASVWLGARQVSGDFYDFVTLSGNRLAMTIADVSDKGIAAAMFMALSRTILRTMTIGKPSPRETIERANDIIISDARSDMFVTVFHAVLDPEDGHLTYVNAGHNPPLIYRAKNKKLSPLMGNGIALGILPHVTYDEHEIKIGVGDVLLLYTDGVTEAIDSHEEQFGTERLEELVAMNAHRTAIELVDEIKRAVLNFAAEGAQFDDLTMVAVKRIA